MVVEDVAEFRFVPELAPSDADGLHRVFPAGPGADVEIVDMLLNVEVAGEPGVIIPVAELVVHVGPSGLALLVPDGAAVVVGVEGVQVSDVAVVDALHDGAEAVAVAQAEAADNTEALFPGEFAGLEDGAHAGGVDGDRFFREDMFAGFNGSLEVHGTEVGRGGEEDAVDPAFNDLPEGVPAGEAPLGGDVDFSLERGNGLEGVMTFVEPVLEEVTHGGEPDVGVGLQGLRCGACSTASAADEAHLDEVGPGGVDSERGGDRGGSGGLEECASAGGGCIFHGALMVSG